MKLFPWVFTLAVLAAAGSLVFAVYMGIAQAQGGVSKFGLSARYIPAFTGAGIDTTALLGPYCKSAAESGGILTITCEDDDDPSNPDAVTTFTAVGGAGGGLDRAAVDARIAAGVAAWSQTSDASAIPGAKLVNAPDNSVTSAALNGATATFTKPDATTFTLDLSGLPSGGGGGLPTAANDGECLVWSNGTWGSGPCSPPVVSGSVTGRYAHSPDKSFTAQEMIGSNSVGFTISYTSAHDYEVTITTPPAPTGTWTQTDAVCAAPSVCGWKAVAFPKPPGRPIKENTGLEYQFDQYWHGGGTIAIDPDDPDRYQVYIRNQPEILTSYRLNLQWPAWDGNLLPSILRASL